jgi:hypothetical protein
MACLGAAADGAAGTTTVAPPGGFTRVEPRKKIDWRGADNPMKRQLPPASPWPAPVKRESAPQYDASGRPLAPPTSTTFERNGDGVYKSRPLRPGEKPTLTPDMIPY